jgi:5'-methylthioadenosine phosphorylase
MTAAFLGIIGGSAVRELPGMEAFAEMRIASPWGEPSGALRSGRIGDTRVAFPARHGSGHRLSPSDVNYRANIDVLKRAGVTDLVATSAVGSLREDIHPGTLVIVDQFIDRTVARAKTFFGAGCVAHVPMAHPVSPRLVARIEAAASAEGVRHRLGGTYVVIEGPQFSTGAETLLHRNVGADIIGMTAMPEAKLAREAELSFACLALVTDYDSWHPGHAQVDVAEVTKVAAENRDRVAAVLVRLARDFPAEHEPCPIGSNRALDDAIMTSPEARDPVLLAKLDAVAGRVLGRN